MAADARAIYVYQRPWHKSKPYAYDHNTSVTSNEMFSHDGNGPISNTYRKGGRWVLIRHTSDLSL